MENVPPEAPRATLRVEDIAAVLLRVPPFSVSAPVPSALSAAIEMVPALIVVTPEYVLAPESLRVPVPVLVKAPAPEITTGQCEHSGWIRVDRSTRSPECYVAGG